MKNLQKSIKAILIVGVFLILLFMIEKCKAQIITLHSVILTNQKLVLDINYSGLTYAMGSISIQITYDSSIYIYDSTIRRNDFNNIGSYIATSASNSTTWFGISWFAINFTDTAWMNNKPLFTCYFTAKQEGCALFRWKTPPLDNCELTDIDGNTISSVYWQDTIICNLTTGIYPTQHSYFKKDKRMYNLLGQEITVPNGFYVMNGRKYFNYNHYK